MDYQVVIVAAGQGARMGADVNKVLLPLKGEPVIVHTLRVFEHDASCAGIVLVVRRNEAGQFRKLLEEYRIHKIITLADGGSERQESVFNGLNCLKKPEDTIVLVHDGARPFIDRIRIAEVVEAADKHGAALLAVPVKDTIKKVDGHSVQKTLERKSLWAAQTPQAFRLSLITKAYREGAARHLSATDDASLVEQMGVPVVTVMGSYRNIKLTNPEDMIIAEKFLEEREKQDACRPRI